MSDRFAILDAARAAVTRREQTYGAPEDNFARIAAFWTIFKGVPFTPGEVALMLGLVKYARAANEPSHADNYVDIAGYAACAGELEAQLAAAMDEIAEATA